MAETAACGAPFHLRRKDGAVIHRFTSDGIWDPPSTCPLNGGA